MGLNYRSFEFRTCFGLSVRTIANSDALLHDLHEWIKKLRLKLSVIYLLVWTDQVPWCWRACLWTCHRLRWGWPQSSPRCRCRAPPIIETPVRCTSIHTGNVTLYKQQLSQRLNCFYWLVISERKFNAWSFPLTWFKWNDFSSQVTECIISYQVQTPSEIKSHRSHELSKFARISQQFFWTISGTTWFFQQSSEYQQARDKR